MPHRCSLVTMSWRLAAALLLSVVCAMAGAQEVPTHSESYSVSYVMVPFTALDSKGMPITTLNARDVKLLVDNVPVESDLFERSHNAPVSFTVLLDGSGSMGLAGKMDAARAAVGTLIARRRPGDDFALYVFDNQEAREVVPFTSDARQIFRALEQIKPFGKTAFFDALATIPERSRLGSNPTRAIILLSDGIDNASRLTRSELAGRLQGIAVPIYPLGLRDADVKRPIQKGKEIDEQLSDLELLDQIAQLTGGKLFIGTQPLSLGKAVAELDRALRAQYLIGFTPTGKGAVKYRRISLRTAGRVRSVRVRAGYLGTEPPFVRAASRNRTRSEKKGIS